jgi:hypothetical protein
MLGPDYGHLTQSKRVSEAWNRFTNSCACLYGLSLNLKIARSRILYPSYGCMVDRCLCTSSFAVKKHTKYTGSTRYNHCSPSPIIDASGTLVWCVEENTNGVSKHHQHAFEIKILGQCDMEVAYFLKRSCRKGSQVYELWAIWQL